MELCKPGRRSSVFHVKMVTCHSSIVVRRRHTSITEPVTSPRQGRRTTYLLGKTAVPVKMLSLILPDSGDDPVATGSGIMACG
jgi:hypothetical protein